MKTHKAIFGAVILLACAAGQEVLAQTYITDNLTTINWAAGSSGPTTVKFFSGSASDGSVTAYSQLNSTRTAIDLGPTRGTLPTTDALCEFVLYRTQDQATNFERMNWTAGSAAIPQYRYGVERGGTGSYRDIVFAFENTSPGVADLPFTISATPVGASSHPLAIADGHLRFDTASRQGAGSSYYIGRGAGANLSINVPTGGALTVSGNNVNNVTFQDTGNVGIGTSSPGALLDVNGRARVGMHNIGSSSSLTVTSGTITVTKSFHTIDTSGGNVTINAINGGTAGDIIYLMKTGTNTVTFPDVGTNLDTQYPGVVLNSSDDVIALLYTGSLWVELSFSDNN